MVNWPSESEVIWLTSRVTQMSLSDLLTTACKDRFTTTSTAAHTCLTDASDVQTHESLRLLERIVPRRCCPWWISFSFSIWVYGFLPGRNSACRRGIAMFRIYRPRV